MISKQHQRALLYAGPEAEATKAPPTESFGEPLPEWHTAIPTWGVAWKIYQYGLGAAFGMLMILTTALILGALSSNRSRRPKKASLIVLVLLFMFGLSRCLYLFIDAYSTKQILPKAVVNLLWSLGNPCIITAYTLIFLVLKNIFVLRERFMVWYTTKNTLIITVPYFSLQLVTEVTLLYVPNMNALTFICQLVYVLLSLLLSFFYSFIVYLLWKNFSAANFQGRVEKSLQNFAWTVSKSNPRGKRTRSILKTCVAAVLGGVTLCVLQIYSMTGVYGVFSDAIYVEAWPWLIFNFATRVLELFLSFVLFSAACTQPTQRQQSQSSSVSLTALYHRRPRQETRVISVSPNAIGVTVSKTKGTTTF
ncbi:uncharacterized protein LOC111320709 [Stylophora pistillata]|uniref:uncharacterized protein LOC111320709 n=1 Tax=Stylophora pistillata TaxID=50429 RepID=UPI000C052487|nr:uncharacterized protein LOC111320709 [Stylophora pistillata]